MGWRGRRFTEVRDLIEANISPGCGVETLSLDWRMEELVFCSLGGISGFSGSWGAVGTWGKGLCRCEHKDVCCPLGKISLTGKRVNVTQKVFISRALWNTSVRLLGSQYAASSCLLCRSLRAVLLSTEEHSAKTSKMWDPQLCMKQTMSHQYTLLTLNWAMVPLW